MACSLGGSSASQGMAFMEDRMFINMGEALAFVDEVMNQSNCILIKPGARHLDIFENLCRTMGVNSNLVPDAYLVAVAIEAGCEFITTDRDYSRFPQLKWRHPFN